MAQVHVSHTLGDLYRDLQQIQRQVRPDSRKTVLSGIRAGNEVAKGYARTKNGPNSHSRKYPGTFSARMHSGPFTSGGSLFGNVISGEYGPRPSGQGLLAPILENGSRSGNAAQLNLAKSADLIGPVFAREVGHMAAGWFWPGAK